MSPLLICLALSLLLGVDGTSPTKYIIRKCGPNEHYSERRTSCEKTCANMDTYHLMGRCKESSGCFCDADYVRNQEGQCVSPHECKKCPENEYMDWCPPGSTNPCPPEICSSIWSRIDCSKYPKECIKRCRCNPPLLRNDQGKCVTVDECMARCGENEVYKVNSTDCQKTCKDSDGVGWCEPSTGCFCAPGYVRNDDNECIKRSECPEKICPDNEYMDWCPPGSTNPCPPEICSSIWSEYDCANYPKKCIKRCRCNPPLLRNDQGKCVTVNECLATCGKNEVYKVNSTDCQKTCNNKDSDGVGWCEPSTGCFCAPGYVRNDDNECIKPCECPPPCPRPPKCPPNEVYEECPSHCHWDDCSSRRPGFRCPQLPAIPLPCHARCVCAEGYLRNDYQICVPEAFCPKKPAKCGRHQVWSDCGSSCPDTCDNLNDPGRLCPDVCRSGCFCIPGYVLNRKGLCVLPEQCSPQTCGLNEVFKECRTICPPQECGVNASLIRCSFPPCEPGCDCLPGYLRDKDGLCIPKDQCPVGETHCGYNEVFKICRTKCPPQTCSARLYKYKCAPNQPCEPGCDCRPGYLRDEDGNCIPIEDCPPLPNECSRENHEVYLKCGPSCPVSCQNYGKDLICPAVCVPGCFCERGYVLDAPTGRCLRLEECPNRQCGENEIFKKCRTICPPQECGVNASLIRCSFPPCEPGCDCLPGYLRDKNGLCIPKDQCPGKETHCGFREVFVSCATICPPQTCASRYTHYNCNPPEPCEPGCDCLPGYLRSGFGDYPCIPIEECDLEAPQPPQCGINEEYNDCGTECERTCKTKDDIIRCRAVCKPGCFCLPGFMRRADGLCTIKDQCGPPRICSPENHEVYQDCGSFCPDSCALFNTDRVCTQQCVQGCFCEEGYVRDTNGQCVLPIDCKPRETCSLENHEIYLECGSDCPDTCDNYGKGQVCGARCVPGCFCQEGYVRDEITRRCLRREECPSRQCGPNQVFSNCGTSCPETCDTLDKQTNRICTKECRIGCVCVPGYVLNDQGDCVLPEQCPQKQCGVNEKYSDCGTACPKTCKNKDQQIKCIALCKKGCFCLPGYVRNDRGVCVLPSQCPGHQQCGPNEVPRKCRIICPPQTCESIFTLYNCIQPQPCEPGCDCIPGYLRDKRGVCILSDRCPTQPQTCGENEEYKSCGTACQRTCKNKDAKFRCIDKCVEGCFCLPGYVRNEEGACVLPEQCPGSQQCGPNEVERKCRILCPPQTCESIFTTYLCVQPQPCEPGCDCIPGYLRDKRGVCILSDRCPGPQPQTCGENEEYNTCGTACPKTCRNKDAKIKCIAKCVEGCFCIPGYVRNEEGACVLPEQCPANNQCKDPNEEFLQCGTACPDTCDNYNSKNRVCTLQCVVGCFCKKGFVRRKDGVCVYPEECDSPIPCPGVNEEYSDCGTACPKTCKNKDQEIGCTAVCKKGCFCLPGYVRNDRGICVLPSECPSNQTCGPNEVHHPCPQICPSQNCEAIYSDYFCLQPQPCEPGCVCVTGYLRTKSGVCIPAGQCPGASNQTCGPNEVHHPCRHICPPQNCESIYTDYSCLQPQPCEPGCDCVTDYLRNKSGVCIPAGQCPGAPQQCGNNEQYDSCGTACPKTCKNKDIKISCIEKCVEGCFCLPGYVRNEEGDCVLPEQCPATNQCKDPNEVFLECGSSCPDTCDNYKNKNRICTLQCVTGCFCRPGYVRRNDGRCVLPAQCPPSCDPDNNEEYQECGTACPETCENYGLPSPCIHDCVRGCFCASGFVRRADGACILPDQCPKQCGKREVFKQCGTACPPTCDNPNPRVCTRQCVVGCFCIDGLVRDANNNCIPLKQCPVSRGCGGDRYAIPGCQDCRETCDIKKSPFKKCENPPDENCAQKCKCIPGYVRDETKGICVRPERCSNINCKPTFVYSSCAHTCPTFDFCPKDRTARRMCSPPFICHGGCACPRGHLIDRKGRCIPAEDCPPVKCGKNEVYDPCPSPCLSEDCADKDNQPTTCNTLVKPECNPRCICAKNHFRKNGTCVPYDECPPKQCGNNEQYETCGTACPRTCKNKDIKINCIAKCVEGCFCLPGYVRNEEGDCVLPEQCPTKTCPANERYVPCVVGFCIPKKCSERDEPVPCPDIIGPCAGGCICDEGFLRDDNGKCVPENQCPPKQCPTNEVYVPCVAGVCQPKYCSDLGKVLGCPGIIPPCLGGCICIEGYLRNDDGTCVPQDQCPGGEEDCNGDPNAVRGCQDCKKTCASLMDPPRRPLPDCPSIEGCQDHCKCKKGYVKDESTGLCVLPERCSNINCGPNQQFDECAFNCSTTAFCPVDYEKRFPCSPPFVCNGGCICKPGFLIDTNGNCIPAKECPPPKCPRNEVYVPCVLGHCKAKRCSQRGKPIPCPKIRPPCPGGCICREGWLRDDNNVCVPENKCPPIKCPKHEVYVDCVIGQCKHKHCSQVGQPIACPSIVGHCAGGCICEPGYLRDGSGNCIPENQCRKCPPHSKYYSCKPWCTVETCAQKEDPPVCIPEHECTGGCVCDKGHLRDAKGNCIPENECTSRCGPNAKFLLCKPHCAVEKCSQVDNPPVCIPEQRCVSGCICVDGFLRDYEGVCVRKDQCPKNTCADPNAEPGCADCTQTCKAIVNPPRICPRPACREGDCRCKEGYVNDTAIGVCVRPEKCSNIKCTYPKVFARCAYNCESDFCPKSENSSTFCNPPYVCPAGCKCRFDHRIDSHGNCIPTEDCPPFDCPRQNEVHSRCPSPCLSERCEDADKPPVVCNTLVKNCIPRCVCRKNHWRNAKGLCVPYDQCPKQCGKKEVFRQCGTACPATCDNPNPRVCPRHCVAGCFCVDGLVRDAHNNCIPPEQCCPRNEIYSTCYYDCPPRKCGSDGIYHCPLQTKSNCKKGCVCLPGYVRDSSGKCIKKEYCPKQCGKKEVFRQCGTACPATCDNPNPRVCPRHCVAGCFCVDGLVRDANNNCIPLKQCPKKCGKKEVFKQCGTACPPTCDNPNPRVCPVQCVAGCFCVDGLVRDANNNCIPPEQCPPECPSGEVYNSCGSACIATCANRGQPQSCTQGCVSGCFCPPGLYRNDENKCVNYDDCTCNNDPNTKPGCGIRCGNTCADYGKNETRICPMACNLFGCDCREGYIYDDVTGKCVLPQDCTHPTRCPKGEIYKECGTACPYTCENRGAVGNCTKQCVSGCFCPDKYYRNDKNKCVKYEDCTCKGDPRTKPGCGTHCGNTCRDHKVIANRRCPIGCSLNGCDCRKPYVYDENTKKCVTVEECSPQCGNNEKYQKCGTACPLTCKNYKNPPPCIDVCVEGCFCRDGFVRAANNTCIRKENCPHECPPHQKYVKCAVRCPTDYCPKNSGPFPICDPARPCPGGCVCESGYKLDRNTEKCIPVSKCPPVKCPKKNEVFKICPRICSDDTCANRKKPVGNCGTGCGRMRCMCRPGYFRDDNGDCVPERDCPEQCPPGEVYNRCGTACPETCENYGKPIGCTKQCVPGCYCRKGQVRNKNGKCIDPKDCPKIGCKGDPNAESGCSNYCGKSCTDYNGPRKPCPLLCLVGGCQCKKGYVYDAVREKCVEPKDCSNVACEGDPNAVLKKCPQPCPATCSRQEPINCLKACKTIGCECKKGYVVGPKGNCIRPDQCPGGPKCRKHEVYKKCRTICPPQTCIAKYALFKCVSPQPCEPGCDCVPGYLRNSAGYCIPSEQCPPRPCPPGEVRDTCGTACPDTCDLRNRPCNKRCVNGCFCPKGKVRDENGKCIYPKDCPKTGCKNDTNAIVINCPYPCPGNCNHPKPIPCKIACKPFGCQCKNGYVVGPKGKCIRFDECPARPCPPGEVRDTCGTACPDTCDLRNRPCNKRCVNGCFCPKGKVRDENGKCIYPKDCPKTGCKNDTNAVVTNCPPPCPGNCNHPKPIPCKRACEPFGCRCKNGYVVGPKGKCIRFDECPGKVCGKNEIPKCCRTICPAQYCGVDPRLVRCAKPPCEPGCDCREGYLRNKAGVCIPKDQCPGENKCPAGEIYKSCGSACPPTCDNYDKRTYCPAHCVSGCFCPEGQVRDKNRKCIDPKDCVKTCGRNEIYVRCKQICPPRKCGVDAHHFPCGKRPCIPGCDCLPGYLRNENNICIPKDQCPGSSRCPPGEVHDKCGTACPDTCDLCDRPCTKQCVDGCFCPKGKVRNENGKCIYQRDCPKTGCKNDINAIVTNCPYPCPGNCNHPKPIPCKRKCEPFGCQCMNGYVIGPKGKCIRFDECPGKVCGKNEIPKPCRTICPAQNCGVDPTLVKCAKPPCEPGCDCREGYLRNKAGVCIHKDQCPGVKTCGRNEIYVRCKQICPPQKCGVDARLILCGKPPCIPGCNCLPGYLRNENNICVPKDQCPGSSRCPPGEVHGTCGTACPDTCDLRNRPCTKQCVNGCFCPNGKVRNENGKCIYPKYCPKTGCKNDINAIVINCPPPCPGTCKHPKPIECFKKCDPFGCKCKNGYVVGPKGKCIRFDECPGKVCGKNEIPKPCRTICPAQNCGVDPRLVRCSRPLCEPGCDCREGYLRNRAGVCIPKDQCPGGRKCGPNQIYSTCAWYCPTDECRKDDGPLPQCLPPPPGHCKPGCRCLPGYKFVRNSNRTRCVRASDCPPIKCSQPKEEVYSKCPSPCLDESCKNRNKPKPCCKAKGCGEPRCICRKGYYRNCGGQCVAPCECPPPSCPPNETYSSCAYDCPPRTCDARDKSYVCPNPSCEPKCQCNEGFLRNSHGDCVLEQDCPPKCPVNEEFSDCYQKCPPRTCEALGRLYKCPEQNCSRGCVCKPDHSRDSNGVCIPNNECPTKCPVNEEYNDCYQKCPPRTCEAIGREYDCPEQNCSRGCVCNPGHSRDSKGVCIPSDQCPNAKCTGANEVFANCGLECPVAFCPINDEPVPECLPAPDCRPGCVCAFNHRRDRNRKCIPTNQCPPVSCTRPNEVFDACPSPCLREGCHDQPSACQVQEPVYCRPRCVCAEGHLRNSDGICVRFGQCGISGPRPYPGPGPILYNDPRRAPIPINPPDEPYNGGGPIPINPPDETYKDDSIPTNPPDEPYSYDPTPTVQRRPDTRQSIG